MQWFKHDSDASNDAKLRKLRFKYGAQGYGIFWYCLELIARNVDKNNLTFELEHDAELIAEDFRLSSELVQEMMTYMVNLGIFQNVNGVITCLKMSNRTDEYTHKLISKNRKYPDTIPTIAGDNQKKSVLIEENRIEEKRNKNIAPLALLMAMGVSESLSKDWIKVRKEKKQAITQTALDRIKSHSEKNGYTFADAVKISCENGWAGFNVAWIDTDVKAKKEMDYV